MKKIILSLIGLAVLTPVLGVAASSLTMVGGAIIGGSLSALGVGVAFLLFNPADLTFTDEQVTSLQDCVYEDVYENPELNQFHKVIPGIVAGKKIGILGLMGMVGKSGQGCDPDSADPSIGASEKTWAPASNTIRLEACGKDFINTFFVWGMNKGIKKADLTNTDFFNFVQERLAVANMEALYRIAWFGDTDAATVTDSPAGILTTGTDVEVDRAVQIAATKRHLDGTIEKKNIFINPTIPIPAGATEVHGISDEMVKDAPTFKQIAVNLQAWFRDCDIGGFNSDKFDIPLLSAEFNRLGIVFIDWDCSFLDTMKAYRQFYPNTLVAIYERLFGEDFDGAHDALNDVLATDRVLEKVIELNFQEDITVKELDDLLQGDRKRFDIAGKIYIDSEGVHRWSFGKYIDKPITIDMGFTQWVLSKDFPADTKSKLRVLISLNK